MCGRYSLFAPPGVLEERFDVRFEFAFEPRYNAAPSQWLPVITNDNPDSVQRLKWGLVPRWADDDRDGHINARAETVDEKPAFADAYESRRCLVLADGFYEWAETGGGKRPYRVAFEDDRPFAMAGLWERWFPDTRQTGLDAFSDGDADPNGESEPVETFTIVTTEPNEVVEPLHHRMAVILDSTEEASWLDGQEVPLDPAPSAGLHSYPVSTAVNDPSNDRPDIVRGVDF
jgi:putative SOS response-associated peptidase YedK